MLALILAAGAHTHTHTHTHRVTHTHTHTHTESLTHTSTLWSLIPYEGQSRGNIGIYFNREGFHVLYLDIQLKFLGFSIISSSFLPSWQDGNYYVDLLCINEETDS